MFLVSQARRRTVIPRTTVLPHLVLHRGCRSGRAATREQEQNSDAEQDSGGLGKPAGCADPDSSASDEVGADLPQIQQHPAGGLLTVVVEAEEARLRPVVGGVEGAHAPQGSLIERVEGKQRAQEEEV